MWCVGLWIRLHLSATLLRISINCRRKDSKKIKIVTYWSWANSLTTNSEVEDDGQLIQLSRLCPDVICYNANSPAINSSSQTLPRLLAILPYSPFHTWFKSWCKPKFRRPLKFGSILVRFGIRVIKVKSICQTPAIKSGTFVILAKSGGSKIILAINARLSLFKIKSQNPVGSKGEFRPDGIFFMGSSPIGG